MPIAGNRWLLLHSIDRLFIRSTTGPMEWTVGRQRIAWGSGRVWNPTDLFNPLNPAVVFKTEKDGVDAVVAKAVLGNFSDATVVWNPRKDLPSNFGMRMRTNVAGCDLAAVGGRFRERWAIGGDMAGSLLDAGVRAEALWSGIDLPASGRTLRATVGIDNQFTEKWYAMMEYHLNGAGTRDRLQYDLVSLVRGEIQNVGRAFVTVHSSYLLHPLLSVTGMVLESLTDHSGYGGCTLSYSASDESSIALGCQYFFGDPLTEFRYYPRMLYLRFDTFF